MNDPIDRSADSTSTSGPSLTVFACIAALSVAALCPLIARADIPGACCFPDGTCDTYINSVACVEDGGTFAGFGVTCDNAGCKATAPTCDTPLILSACPPMVIFETRSVDGVEFDLSNLPVAEGCDVVVTIDPPLGARLPVGVTLAVVTAESAFGEIATCDFSVVVDLVDEVGPIEKRRIKGGGSPTTEGGVCESLSPLIGGASCGVCQIFGLLCTFAGMAASRRRVRTCRKSRLMAGC
ncbi:MAG: hypothetical protein H6818_09100 [Phycisphaerales bacterium]|nr:hypothetical protein [Phycisphaerales bacterium]MCB9862727.1 hypothetical protein [Phycisphaerales bacterium]